MACDDCHEKDLQIAELEKLLEGAIYVRPNESALIARGLNLTPQEAALVVLMYRNKRRFADNHSFAEALPWADERAEHHERNYNLVSVMVSNIRKKTGRDFIENQWGAGYRLSDAAYETVGELLKAFSL